MSFVQKMTPEQRAGTVSVSLLLVGVWVACAASYSVNLMREAGSRVIDRYLPALDMIANADRELHRAQMQLNRAVVASSTNDRRQRYSSYAQEVATATERMRLAAAVLDDDPAIAQFVARARLQQHAWSTTARELMKVLEEGRSAGERVVELTRELDTRFEWMSQTTAQIVDVGLKPIVGEERQNFRDRAIESQWSIWGSLGLGLGLGSAIILAAIRLLKANLRQQAVENDYRDFYRRVHRALQLVEAEPAVLSVVRDALGHVLSDGRRAELLLADSTRARIARVASAGGARQWRGCAVAAPHECPAVRRNTRMVFPSSRSFEACAFLKDRGDGACSAVCLPVSIMGNTAGVLHTLGPDGLLPSSDELRKLDAIALQAGDEISMVRAFTSKEKQANTDTLTGIANRRSLEARMPALLESGELFSVAYGDLDYFKKLNDVHGHEAGDRALRLFADVLKGTLRPSDLYARWGGEEFVLVLPGSAMHDSARVLERVRARLAERVANGPVPAFTASFGVSDSRTSETFETILHRADAALRRAKQQGRNCVVCDDALEPIGDAVRDAGYLDAELSSA